MNILESQLANRLHDMMDDEVGSAPPALAVLSRGQRAGRRRTATMVATASLAVVAVGGVTVAAVAQPWAQRGPGALAQSRPGAAAQVPAPRPQLAAAVAASQNISYRVKVTQTYGPGSVQTTDGAFDPASATGYLNSTSSGAGVTYEERLVNGVRYVSSSGSPDWKQDPGTYDRLSYDQNLNGAPSASVDPQQLFETLRNSGATVSQTGPRVFHFEVTVDTPATARTTLSQAFVGDVTLNADKRIAKVAYRRTDHGTKDGSAFTETTPVTVELSSYGLPVRVDKPTSVVGVK
ncbi:MAG TPA: hypothetical protein VGJ07_19620 [Rugosimonospora sp.]